MLSYYEDLGCRLFNNGTIYLLTLANKHNKSVTMLF